MMCADGRLMKLSLNDNADVFYAALVSLGALGVIVSLKIQCEQAFRLHQVQYGLPLKDVRTCSVSFCENLFCLANLAVYSQV